MDVIPADSVTIEPTQGHVRPSDAEIQSSVKRLRQQFGRHLDEGVLSAVLEMHEFNYQEAEKFLQAENNDNTAYDYQHFNPATAEDSSIPAKYFDLPVNFKRTQGEGEPSASSSADSPAVASAEAENPALTMRDLFTRQSTFAEHYSAQNDQLISYISNLLTLVRNGYEVKDSAKARCLAALWAHKRYKLADYFLSPQSNRGAGYGFGLTEVLKAVNLLDSARKIRVLEKRLALLHLQPKVRPRTQGKVTAAINDLKREPVTGSLSGALTRHIRRWISTLTKEELQFFAVHLPKKPWTELADLLHPHPKKDFAEPWFLEVAYGQPAPAESMVSACETLSAETVLEVVKQHSPPYTYLRKNKDILSPEVLAHVASYTPLETLIWWYEELRSHEVDIIIQDKLQAGEELKMGYGKLMERLLTFKSMGAPFLPAMVKTAEAKLANFRLPLEPPVVCFGDASYSMDVAIRVSTIIASVLTAITNADLRFFNTESIVPPKVPRTIEDVLDLTMTVKADKLTAPAVALLEYYEKKIPVRTFVVVTDEVENLPHEGGDFFAQLFYKYRQEVEPNAQLVFVSFLPNQNVKGRMVTSLEKLGIMPLFEMKLDGARPDLTKLDSMLATLSARTDDFKEKVGQLGKELEGVDWAKGLEMLEPVA